MSLRQDLRTAARRRRIGRRAGVLALVALSAALYNRVRAEATAEPAEWSPALAAGKAPRIQSGTAGPILIQKPAGQTAFSVAFPVPYKSPPRVVLTVVADTALPVSARLVSPATPAGFRAVAAAQYFTQQASVGVSINWLAIGE